MRQDTQAVSPAISTVIITATIVTLLLVTIVFANTFLESRVAENEFRSSKQFMLTAGLQIDDIAWTIGRTQTVRYSSKYGFVKFEPSVLSYSFEVFSGSAWHLVFTNTTGIIVCNMPTSTITFGNNYFERIFPSDGSFLQSGPSAPVNHVFVAEKLPMADGSYTRVVVAPSIRLLSSVISGQSVANYSKFFLPSLSEGSHPHLSQSITLTGNEIAKTVESDVSKVRISVSFPNASQGYDSTFFNFESTSETVDVSSGSVVEFYVSNVIVSIGLH